MYQMFLPVAGSLLTLILISSAARAVHHFYFEHYFKLTFVDAPVWSLFYFGAWSVIVVVLFPHEIRQLLSGVTIVGYLLLAFAMLVVFPGIYRSMRKRVGNPEWLALLFPEQGMLTLEERYIIAKIGDVIFQQLIAGAMIFLLLAHGFVYPQIVGIFLVLFTLAHLYIFRTAGFFWGMHYTAYAALGGFAFPFLIIYVPGGVGYAIILHMLFYVLSAAYFAKLPHPKNTNVLKDCLGVTPAKA